MSDRRTGSTLRGRVHAGFGCPVCWWFTLLAGVRRVAATVDVLTDRHLMRDLKDDEA